MRSMTQDEARRFAERWLPAWTGNNPLKLASFYTDDLFYSDPTLPDGVIGKEAFIRYLSKLLGNNPDWVCTHESAIPMQDGFLNKWRLDAPVGDRAITCRGVRTVQMIGGLIYRNETYFDTLHLITAIRNWNTEKEARRKPPGVVEVNVRPD
jgi:SnoaL-like domain